MYQTSKQRHTLASSGNLTLKSVPGMTFIIKPSEHSANLSFTKNPIKLARALKEEPFSNLDRKNVRVNQRRNLIAIEVNSINDSLKEQILSTKSFAEVEVQVYIPKSEIQVMGVIGPIDQSVTMDELRELLKCEGDFSKN